MRASPERILAVLDRADRGALPTHEITRALRIDRDAGRAVAAMLRELERAGRIEQTRGGWRLVRAGSLVAASCREDDDGGLVAIDEGGRRHAIDPDAALPGERILLEPRENGQAEVVSALGGGRREWIGILTRRGRDFALVPYRDETAWQWRIERNAARGAQVGDVVVATPAPVAPRRGRGRATPTLRIVEVLGPPGTPEADVRAIAWRHRLRRDFPSAVLAAANETPSALPPDEAERRLDLRDRAFVTIDPATARDHDDAVCVEPLDAGRVRLWVAIADVSYFVPEDGPLDREARRRGNSVYFPDRAIPMLPERLSGELCSLRPDVDRPVLAVELLIDDTGAIERAHFHEAQIRSRARLVYDAAAVAMEGGTSSDVPAGEVTGQLQRLAGVAKRLTARRRAAGAIDLDLPSAEIVLGDEGRPTDIIEAPRTIAHRAIEEAMLAANRAVAEHLLAHEVPALYRVHEPPTPQATVELRALLESFGLVRGAREDRFGAREIAEALKRADGRPEERLVNTAALRSMRPARYDARCLGHFALAFDAYLHFTSPIRRYADLVVHRALRDSCFGGAAGRARANARAERMPTWAERTSLCERTAMAAEREAVDLAKCVFMRSRVGEHFDATISRVARHGFYATLDPFFVDCLVPLRTLPGNVALDERGAALVARRGATRFALGDRVRVVVTQVDLVKGWIDAALESYREPAPVSPRSRRTRGATSRRSRAGRR